MDVYQIITQQIINSLETNEIPWKRTWISKLPTNLVSKKPYSGINLLLLAISSTDSYFVTYNQAKKLGGSVKKGEKSHIVIFWKLLDREVENASGIRETVSKPFLRYYRVFGFSQTEGLQLPEVHNNEQIVSCQELIDSNNPTVAPGEPSYVPFKDCIHMPDLSAFKSSEDYYATFFHELGHWTGHKSRLNREEINGRTHFGTTDYSKEELTAELTASCLCSTLGIQNDAIIENEQAYIKGWLNALNSDSNFIISASSKARKATEFLMGEATSKSTSAQAS